MENDITMEMNEGAITTKKSKLPIIGVVAAVLLVIIIVVFAVFTSPKVLMGILIGRTPDTVSDFFNAQREEQPLFMRESHQSETKISMDGEVAGIDGNIELEILTAYQNATGDLATELEVGIGDLDAVTAGLYLSGSEIALISSVLSDKYVVDLESEDELDKNTTLEARLMALVQSGDDEKMDELVEKLKEKVLELRKFGIKELPRAAMEKGKDSVEVFGKDQNLSYVEAVMDEDYFKDWAEIVLEQISEDEDLEDLIVEIAEQLNDTVAFEGEFDADDIDIEEYCEDLLDELDDMEAEVEFRIYYKGFTPIAYDVKYEDQYTEGEGIVLLYSAGNETQMTLEADIDGEEIYYDIYADGDKYQSIKYELDGMMIDITLEEVKNGLYEIDGSFDYGEDLGGGTIEGEIEELRNETVFEMTLEFDDMDTEVTYEGSIVVDGSVTTTEVTMEMVTDGEDTLKVELEYETDEVKKNKEYVSEGKLTITDVYSDMEYVIDFENETIFGDDAQVDLPSWSNKDVYAEISDEEAMEELFDGLFIDLEEGFADVVALIMFGEMY